MNKSNFLNYVIIIVCFFGVVIFLWPKFQEMEIVRKNIDTTKQTLEQKKVIFLTLIEYRDKLGKYQEQLTKIAFALPDDIELNLPSLFRFLQKTSAETGLILTKIKPFDISSLEERPEIKKTKFGIQVKGTYVSFKAFLVKLEKSARIIKVENISFFDTEEGELFNFDIIISVYSY